MGRQLKRVMLMIEIIRIEREKGSYRKKHWEWAAKVAEKEIASCREYLESVENTL